MGINFDAVMSCAQCKKTVKITLSVHKTAVNSNGVIGPGHSASIVGTVHAHLPEGWVESNYSGTFCSEKCEDDYYEASWGKGHRPNDNRRAAAEREKKAQEVMLDRYRQALKKDQTGE